MQCHCPHGTSEEGYPKIMPFLPQAHAVSGCDSVARYHGIGKATVVKAMKKKNFQGFVKLGNLECEMEYVLKEATDFIGECYEISTGKYMSEKR